MTDKLVDLLLYALCAAPTVVCAVAVALGHTAASGALALSLVFTVTFGLLYRQSSRDARRWRELR